MCTEYLFKCEIIVRQNCLNLFTLWIRFPTKNIGLSRKSVPNLHRLLVSGHQVPLSTICRCGNYIKRCEKFMLHILLIKGTFCFILYTWYSFTCCFSARTFQTTQQTTDPFCHITQTKGFQLVLKQN